MTKRKKTALILITVAVGLVVVASSLFQEGPKGTVVQAELARVGDIEEKVSATGRVQPQTKVDITSQVSGEVVGLFVNEGDVVAKGDPLIQLDTVQLDADVQQMRYSLDEIEARAEASRVRRDQDAEEFDRQKKLYEKKLTSETAYTNAKYAKENSAATYKGALAQVKTQRARLEKALDQLGKTRILAPMDGVITFLNTEVGEIAQAQTSFTQGKTLMTISDLSVFEVDVEVDETEIAKIDLSQAAKIEIDAYPDSVFTGSVVEIGNSAIVQNQSSQEFSINFRVKVRFDPTSATIRPGMSASVDITTGVTDGATIVPYASLVMREIPRDTVEESAEEDTSDGLLVENAHAETPDNTQSTQEDESGDSKAEEEKVTGVFVVRDGVAEFVPVKTGIADEKDIVILSGMQKGDTVVSGSFKTLRELGHGDEVTIDKKSLEKMEGKDLRSKRSRGDE